MSNGYDMTCQPGALGMQDCFINVHTPTGCVAGAPGCVITQQKIIKWTDGGPVTQAPSTSSWMAWVPQLWSLNIQGDQYSPFGPTGIPYTMDGMVGWAGKGSNFDKMGWTDPQSKAYLDSIPGAGSRYDYQNRVCDPLWPTFGCRTGDPYSSSTVTTAPEEEESWSEWFSNLFGAEGSDRPTRPWAGLVIFGIGAVGIGLMLKDDVDKSSK